MNAPASLGELRDVSFRYRKSDPLLLSHFDIEITDGSFVALLGPSGCGKTTILNLLAGFDRVSEGTVRFDGQPLGGVNTNVGYMTQGDTLLPWRTVRRNLELPLEIRGLSRSTADRRIDDYLRLLDLEEAAEMYPSQLSGGMKRRALMARSLIYDPRMLLMDEPFIALDAQLRDTLHRELLITVQRLGQTVLFVTHDIQESCLLADRIVLVGARPLRIIDDVVSPFDEDRDLGQIRTTPEFIALEARLRAALSSVTGS